MATRKRQNTNPFMSANLGSGARTTTGGTYENPRLGIQDYTAFGSGVASTFKMPEQEEVEKKDDLTLDLGDFESDRDDFYVDSNGIMQDLNSDVSTLINNTWKGSELTFLNNAYQKALAGSQQERDIKSHLNGYSQAIGPKDKTKKTVGLNIDGIQVNSYKGSTVEYGAINKFIISFFKYFF